MRPDRLQTTARDEHRILAQMDELLEQYYRSRGGIGRGEPSLRREVFSDFLDMAAHLLEKYHHPSAATSAGVLAGATLEEYLRKLADANGIATANSGGEPVKAESLNTELRAEGAYDLSEQMQVTAWLDLRNKAARGRRDEFSADQVRLMIQGVRDFTVRHLA
jgi:hypothetical protein